jgi:hypothetical protein
MTKNDSEQYGAVRDLSFYNTRLILISFTHPSMFEFEIFLICNMILRNIYVNIYLLSVKLGGVEGKFLSLYGQYFTSNNFTYNENSYYT